MDADQLEYYRQQIPEDQFRLLADFLSCASPGGTDDVDVFYPDDLYLQNGDRFAGLDLEYYRQRIPADQFRLLQEMVGVKAAPDDFDPACSFYPDDLNVHFPPVESYRVKVKIRNIRDGELRVTEE